MRFIDDLCPPALLYLIFLVIQLGLDLSLGLWITFTVKVIFGLIVTVLLDTFCGIGLTPVSWFFVALPFLITAIATAVSMGTQFDRIVLQDLELKESFEQKGDDEEDINVPKSSNSAERQASSEMA
jgi:hypothetical protein